MDEIDPSHETATGEVSEQRSEITPQPANLDLLMGIELLVTLRFGARQIPLREILELGPGSVLGLDQQLEEPAELLVGGELIARGEVLVADGRYALRVTEITGGRQGREPFAR